MGDEAPARDLEGAHRLIREGAGAAIGLLALAQGEPTHRAKGKEHLPVVRKTLKDLFAAAEAINLNRDVESLLASVPHKTPPYPPPFGLSGPSGHAIAVKLIEQVASIVTWATVDAMPEDAEQVRALWPWSIAGRIHGTRPKHRPPCIGGASQPVAQAIKRNLGKLWPDAADALRDIKTGDLDVDDGWLRETMAVELNAAQRTATGDERRKPVHLDYVVEVAKSYLDTVRRVENAKAKGYSQAAVMGLENHRDALGQELTAMTESPNGYAGGTIEQVDEWQRMEKSSEPLKLATAVVRHLASESAPLPPAPPAPASTADDGLVLTEKHQAILFYLEQNRGTTIDQYAIVQAVRFSRNTVSKLLKELRAHRLAYRPHGKNSGEAITTHGLQRLESLRGAHKLR